DADLVLWLVDAQHEMDVQRAAAPLWVVRNKLDLDGVRPKGAGLRVDAAKPAQPASALEQAGGSADFTVSECRGDGIQQVIAALVVFAQDYFGSAEGGLIGRERQRKLLQETAGSVQRSLRTL